MNPEKKEIIQNIINAGLAGGLVFFGAFVSGEFTLKLFVSAVAVSFIAMITQFKDYWKKKLKTPTKNKSMKVFSFVKL